MNDINPKFNSTDALLLYSIAYCQRHNESTTLGGILLTTDAINREYPMAKELEEGFSRLIIGGYVAFQEGKFATTKSGLQLFNDVTKPRIPKLNVFEQLRLLTDRLNRSPIIRVEKQLTIASDDVSKAVQEAHVLFEEAKKKSKDIMNAQKAKGSK